MSLVYVERLMEQAGVILLATNWRPILLCGLLLASKARATAGVVPRPLALCPPARARPLAWFPQATVGLTVIARRRCGRT